MDPYNPYAGLLNQGGSPGMGLLAQSPSPGMLGTGAAKKAAQAAQSRPAYQKYVEDQQINGQSFLSYEEWVRAMQNPQPTQPAGTSG